MLIQQAVLYLHKVLLLFQRGKGIGSLASYPVRGLSRPSAHRPQKFPVYACMRSLLGFQISYKKDLHKEKPLDSKQRFLFCIFLHVQ